MCVDMLECTCQVRWHAHNCLLTPPQYVRIIANTALFRDRGGRRGEEGEGEGTGWRCRYPSTTWRLRSVSDSRPALNLTNYSTLYPPISPSVIPPSFHTSFPFIPLLCFYLFSHRLTPPIPLFPPFLLPERTTTCKEKYD